MSDQEKSTPLSDQHAPEFQPPARTPRPPQQQHDPESPENLLQAGKKITARDLAGPSALSPEDDAELKAAEEKILREHEDGMSRDSQGPSELPPQPEMGAPFRQPTTTNLEDEDAKPFDQRSLPAPRRNLELYQPPPVPITDEDMTRMLECIIHNKHYSEVFEKGPVRVKFRVKSAKEVDYQRANLSRMAADGEFGLMSDFQAAIARFNQLFEVVEYNDRQVAPVQIPPRPWKKEHLNLEQQYWASWLADITESAGYIIHGLMIQFEDKVYRMQQRMLDPDFTMPAAPSSSAKGSPEVS